MAATENDKNLIKVMLLGEHAVGKTCLVARVTVNVFTENFITTVGAEHDKYETDTSIITIFDADPRIAKELTTRIAPEYVVINFDISDRNSFEKATNWVKELERYGQKDQKIILSGNKSDLEDDRKVTINEAQQLADENKCMLYIETSAKNGTNCRKLFEEISNDATKKSEAANVGSKAGKLATDNDGKPLFNFGKFKEKLIQTQENSKIRQPFKSVFFDNSFFNHKKESPLVYRILNDEEVSYQEIKDYAEKNPLGTVNHTLKKFDTSEEEAKLSSSPII